jgi:hypothetical protein
MPLGSPNRLGMREYFKGRKVLITGHNGFKGAWKEKGVNLFSARAGNVIGYGDWGNHRLLPDLFWLT